MRLRTALDDKRISAPFFIDDRGEAVDTNHDKVFVTTFLGVIGFLVALTIGIVMIANMISGDDETDEIRQIARERTIERIAPIGQVVTDPAALKVAAASDEPASDDRTGEQVVAALCSGCHIAGVAGAPKTDDTEAWSQRLAAAGLDGLIASVVNGKGAMPPMAGDPSLSESQIESSVKVMLDQAGVSY